MCRYIHIRIFVSINAYFFLQREGTWTIENWAMLQNQGKNRNCPSSQYHYLFFSTFKYLHLSLKYKDYYMLYDMLCSTKDYFQNVLHMPRLGHRGPITDPWLSQTWLLHRLRTQVARIFCPWRFKQCPGSRGLGEGGYTGAHPPPFSQQRAWRSRDSSKRRGEVSVVNPPSLEQGTGSPDWGQQLGQTKLCVCK